MIVKNENQTWNSQNSSLLSYFVLSDEDFVYPKLDFSTPFFLDGITLVIFKEGECRIKINLKEWHIKKNTLLTIFPGSLLIPIEKSDDLKIEFLFFSIDFFSNWDIVPGLDIERLENHLILEEKQINDILEFHSFILKRYKNNMQLHRDELIKSLLNGFIIELTSIYQQNLNDNVPPQISKNRKALLFKHFIQLITKYHTKERRVSFYANQMCITDKHLGQVIKKASGKLASDWISYMTILSIKASLCHTQKTILQISEDYNFPNPSFFNQFFKKHTGLTPKKYRENH